MDPQVEDFVSEPTIEKLLKLKREKGTPDLFDEPLWPSGR